MIGFASASLHSKANAPRVEAPLLVLKLRGDDFQGAGFSVCDQAEDGAQAIALARLHPPDLIILDLAMPVMNGLEAAPELKRNLPRAPIILFTLYLDMQLTTDAAAAGISSVVAKSDFELLLRQARLLSCKVCPVEGFQSRDSVHVFAYR